ncbi:hypothetical protein RSJ22_06360 [Clostridium botulinum]|nr:hypothetical protein RSJ14_05900 [Clostridium botulinum]AUN23645.1 hypothetical protein RSJ22_06360 [Clostridium botulinum]KON11300.1 hypothetical protein ACP52_01390 [Clostridium botulinum]MBN3349931.1 hypothetical protein [Clostridium botulinum]MBN3358028.1 hypothetical protein [Clostridium botulinum]
MSKTPSSKLVNINDHDKGASIPCKLYIGERKMLNEN